MDLESAFEHYGGLMEVAYSLDLKKGEVIVESELDQCPHCDSSLKPRRNWHMRKSVQTLQGPLFVAGKSKECTNANAIIMARLLPENCDNHQNLMSRFE